MAKGFDTSTGCTQKTAETALKEGYTFAVRYYATNAATRSKTLKPDEARTLSGAGLYLVTVFQDYNNEAKWFSTEYGRKNGTEAYKYARDAIGQPSGTPIYFAVDYDADSAQAKGCITDYFTEISRVFSELGGAYKIGVYGSGLVCRHLKETSGLAAFSWLSMSTGFRESKKYLAEGTWNLHQIKNVTINGVGCDLNESSDHGGGGWRYE